MFGFVLENGRQGGADAGRRLPPRRQRLTRLRLVVTQDARGVGNGARVGPLLDDAAVRVSVVSVVVGVAGQHVAMELVQGGQRRRRQTPIVNVVPRRRRRRCRRFALAASQAIKHRRRFLHQALRDGFQSIFQIGAASGGAGGVGGHFRTTLAGFLNGQLHIFHAVEDVIQTGGASVVPGAEVGRGGSGAATRRRRQPVVLFGNRSSSSFRQRVVAPTRRRQRHVTRRHLRRRQRR